MSELASGCAHCSKCTDNCVFLQKYTLDLAGLETSPQITRECMLCGKCTEVCPKGIEGAALVLNLREKRKTISLRHLPMVLTLKSHLFRSYYSDPTTSVLFPGCNLPAFFPRTMEALDRLARDAGMGVAYDCCGKPLSYLGRSDDALGIAVNLERLGAAELVCACPNCYVFLKSRLRLPVITIYEKLAQWGIKGLTVPQGSLFLPCPDCNERLFLRQIAALLQLKSLYNKAHYVLQRGLGLGAHMNAAFSYVLRQGYAYSLLIGSDIPLITCEDITDAASILMTRDVVLGPCDDGGYWLVGLKKPFPQMFFGQHYDDLARGGESVLATARETCCFYNKTHGLAAKKCDIDTFDDFLYYQQRVNELQSSHLYRFFRDCECR